MSGPENTAVFDEAFAILREEPLPADSQARLMELERRLSGKDLDYFGDVWEAWHAAGGMPVFDDD